MTNPMTINRSHYFTYFSATKRENYDPRARKEKTWAATLLITITRTTINDEPRFLLPIVRRGIRPRRKYFTVHLFSSIGKISPFVSIVMENQCAFFTSRRTIGKGNAEASEAVSLPLPIVIFPFSETPSICSPGSIEVCGCFAAIRAEMLQVPF